MKLPAALVVVSDLYQPAHRLRRRLLPLNQIDTHQSTDILIENVSRLTIIFQTSMGAQKMKMVPMKTPDEIAFALKRASATCAL